MADLMAEIHAATRKPHADLNRLITARLPLALPPHAESPRFYALGLSRFAEVYLAFEEAWHAKLEGAESGSDTEYDVLDSFVNDDSGRVQKILRAVHAPAILRSKRLTADLLALNALDHGGDLAPDPGTGPSAVEDGQGKLARQQNAAVDFAAHIKHQIDQKPHVLLAYAWSMYMALFNGGRWIRSTLVKGGPRFWQVPAAGAHGDLPPLSFWFFDDDQDGETVKMDFKARFRAAENLLTETERRHVIEEAVEIFRRCGQIVTELDVAVARTAYRESRQNRVSVSTSASSLLSPSLFGPESLPLVVLAGFVGVAGGICAFLWKMKSEAMMGLSVRY